MRNEKPTINVTDGEFECNCGNLSHLDGFDACNDDGVPRDPDEKWDGDYFVCLRCGNIIEQVTSTCQTEAPVMGFNLKIRSTYLREEIQDILFILNR